MTASWPLQLSIDSYGGDLARVYPRRATPAGSPHLVVRVGPVLMHCLDTGALQDTALAWARAVVVSDQTLPGTPAPRRDPLRDTTGYGSPAGVVIAEGPQCWQVQGPHPDHPYTVVSSPSLTVRVHDKVALDTHARAWAFALDLSQRVLDRPPPAFNRLLEQERSRYVNTWHDADERTGRGRAR